MSLLAVGLDCTAAAVFSILDALNVCDSVNVVATIADPIHVVAIVYALVGYSGVNTFAVIFVGGTGCIGAYFVRPVCRLYGTVNSAGSAAPPAAAPALLETLFTVAGPAVAPLRRVIAVSAAAGVVPVMPLSVKRSE